MQERHKIEMLGYECEGCHYKWVPRKQKEYPKVCPNCHIATWDVKKKRVRA